MIDECVVEGLAATLREYGYDAVNIHELGLKGITDEKLLEIAAKEERVVLSHNIKDFVVLAKKWAEKDKLHRGIILVDEIEFGRLLRKITHFLQIVTSEEMINQVRYI